MDIPRISVFPNGRQRATEASDLPEPNTRWSASKKAQLLTAIAEGVISREEARATYALSDDELESWANRISLLGIGGLKEKAIQRLRPGQSR